MKTKKQLCTLLAAMACTMSLWGGHTVFAASIPNTYTKNGVTYTHYYYEHQSIPFREGLLTTYYNDEIKGYALVVYKDNTYTTVSESETGTYAKGENIIGRYGGETASVSGGENNEALYTAASVSGGWGNTASGDRSSVSGGSGNIASDSNASVSGGYNNKASNSGASVSGGQNNTAGGPQSSVSGGENNKASGFYSSVSGGKSNTAGGESSSVSGGYQNTASNWYSSVSGGMNNTASGSYSSVSGGENNKANGSYSFVSGGYQNTASEENSSVSGGQNNTASGDRSSVSGGYQNTASGICSSAFGGKDSRVKGIYSTGIAGGSTGENAQNSLAAGYKSVVTVENGTAIGYQATANQDGTIAFGHDVGDENGSINYSSAYYNRLVKVADGQSAHDVATVGQTATVGSTNGSVKITKSTNTNGSTNYDLSIDKVTVNTDGVIENGNTGILSGGTAYTYLQNAIFYDSSAKDLLTFKGASGTKLTNLKDGALTATSTDAVTGRQLYATNQNMAGFADQITKNASKLEALSTSVTNSLDSVSAMSESVSTIDNTKADASLNNLSDAGKEVIHAAATEAVQAYMKNLNNTGTAKSTMKVTAAKMYTASPSSLLTTSLFALPATNAVSTLDTASDLSGKADVSYVDEGLATKADKDTVYTKEETDTKLTGKADTDLKNLSESGKGVIKDVMKDDLAKKANTDASNIDAAAYAKKLGTGTVTSGDTNLVTGGTVYTALSKSGIGLVQSDGQVMTVGAKDSAAVVDFHNAAGSGRVLTGVTTNAEDLTSAANVGYVNSVASGLSQDFSNQIQQTSSMLTRDINKVGAGAAALAGLHPGEYDPADKWDFAAGYGHYKGANASAFGAYYHPNEDTLISLSGTIGNGDPMLSAGVTFKLGSGVSPHTMSRTALTKELNTVKDQNTELSRVVQTVTAQNNQLHQEVETLKAQVQQLLARTPQAK